MGSDPIRALVELITNADDAYDAMQGTTRGKIRVEVERRRRGQETSIRVLDRAVGMSLAEMEDKLGSEGKRTSGFEQGANRRGLLGRGAKDIVHFGPVEWVSERDGKRSRFTLLYDNGPTMKWETDDLGDGSKKAHGTTVTARIQPRFKVKTHDNLRNALCRHYQLRPVLMDRTRREVRLVDKNQDRDESILYEMPKGTVLAQDERREIPGYPGDFVRLTLGEYPESLDDGESKEYWRHSVVITSGRAAYDVFIGKFGREPWSTFLGRLYGQADVPAIAELIRDYDDREEKKLEHEATNPIRLVRRDRAGLVSRDDHPFVEALCEALEAAIEPHLERIREEAEKSESSPIGDQLSRRLRELGHLLPKLLEEEDISGGLSGGAADLPPLGLSIIPERRIADPDSDTTVLVRFRAPEETGSDLPRVAIRLEHDDASGSLHEIYLEDRRGYFSRSFLIAGRPQGSISEAEFQHGSETVKCYVEWKERHLPRVEKLEFEHATYTVKDGSEKTIRLLAPWDLVASSDPEPRFELSGSPNISLVQRPLLFGHDDDRDCAASSLTVRGRGVGSRAKLVASLGESQAECELVVRVAGSEGIRIRIDEFNVNQRAYMSEDGATLNINARDSSVRRYLGPKSRKWPGQDQLHFRTMLAEIIAYTFARFAIQRKRQEQGQTSLELFGAQMRLMEKWLPRVHSTLVPSADLPRLS